MAIQLRPELEELIRQDIQRGPYASVDEFVESAVMLLHGQETWLACQRADIADRIEAGWSAAQQNDLAAADAVR